MLEPRTEGAAVSVRGTILVTGGWSNNPQNVNVYDVATRTWAQGTPMPSGRSNHIAAVAGDGRVHVIGGERLPDTQTSDLMLESWVYAP